MPLQKNFRGHRSICSTEWWPRGRWYRGRDTAITNTHSTYKESIPVRMEDSGEIYSKDPGKNFLTSMRHNCTTPHQQEVLYSVDISRDKEGFYHCCTWVRHTRPINIYGWRKYNECWELRTGKGHQYAYRVHLWSIITVAVKLNYVYGFPVHHTGYWP